MAWKAPGAHGAPWCPNAYAVDERSGLSGVLDDNRRPRPSRVASEIDHCPPHGANRGVDDPLRREAQHEVTRPAAPKPARCLEPLGSHDMLALPAMQADMAPLVGLGIKPRQEKAALILAENGQGMYWRAPADVGRHGLISDPQWARGQIAPCGPQRRGSCWAEHG